MGFDLVFFFRGVQLSCYRPIFNKVPQHALKNVYDELQAHGRTTNVQNLIRFRIIPGLEQIFHIIPAWQTGLSLGFFCKQYGFCSGLLRNSPA